MDQYNYGQTDMRYLHPHQLPMLARYDPSILPPPLPFPPTMRHHQQHRQQAAPDYHMNDTKDQSTSASSSPAVMFEKHDGGGGGGGSMPNNKNNNNNNNDTTSRKRTYVKGDKTLAVTEELITGPSLTKRRLVKKITSGEQLDNCFGEAINIPKRFLPNNTLIHVKKVNLVDVKGSDQAVYMVGRIFAQEFKKSTGDIEDDDDAEEEEEEEDGDENVDNAVMVTDSFVDFNGERINNLISCTASQSLTRAILTGGLTVEQIEGEGVVMMVNEMGDREHPMNKFMGNCNLCYQHHMQNKVPANVMRALLDDGNIPQDELLTFFKMCLKKSKTYKRRNIIFCASKDRFSDASGATRGVGTKVSRAIKSGFN